jgi:hypothetical protein
MTRESVEGGVTHDYDTGTRRRDAQAKVGERLLLKPCSVVYVAEPVHVQYERACERALTKEPSTLPNWLFTPVMSRGCY